MIADKIKTSKELVAFAAQGTGYGLAYRGHKYTPQGNPDDYFKYGAPNKNGKYTEGDIVDMELNLINATLTFIINGQENTKTIIDEIDNSKSYKMGAWLNTTNGSSKIELCSFTSHFKSRDAIEHN